MMRVYSFKLMLIISLLLSVSLGCFRKLSNGSPNRKGDNYARWYYCFDSSITNQYHHEFAKGVADYNENTQIRWYHSCDASRSYHTVKAAGGNWFGGKTISILNNFGRLYAKSIHEMGHAVGFCHEHRRPDRDNHPNDASCGDYHRTQNDGGESAQNKISTSDWYNRGNINGWKYDCQSIMHYWANLGSGINLYKWVTFLWTGWWSSTNNIGGYNLSPSDKIQINYIYNARSNSRQNLNNKMPSGNYAYLMPRSGCPDGFEDSIVYFDDEDSNNGNNNGNFFNYIAGYQDIGGAGTLLYFCISRNSGNGLVWPSGSYCILPTNSASCPSGFSSGIRYSDNEDSNNANDAYGKYTPYGAIYEQHNSRMHYCCRNDGNAGITKKLFATQNDGPNAFTLYRKGGTCQSIEFYTSQSVWIYQDDEDDNNNNHVINGQNLPDGTYDRNTKYYVCVYTKIGSNSDIFTWTDLHNDKYIDLDNPELDPELYPNDYYTFRIKDSTLLIGGISILLICLCCFILSKYCINGKKQQQMLKQQIDIKEEEDKALVSNEI